MQIQHILWREFIENIENDLNLKNNYWTCCCTMIMLCSETKMIGGITVSKWQIPYPQEVKVAGYIRTQFSLTAPISRPVPTRRSIRRNRLRKRQRSIPDSCARRFMRSAKKPLNGSLQTRKRNTRCGIHTTFWGKPMLSLLESMGSLTHWAARRTAVQLSACQKSPKRLFWQADYKIAK